jgi:hypothetical protein
MVYTRLSGGPDFTVAVAAIDRLIAAGLKRYFRAFAALGAGCGEHLARGSVVAVPVTCGLPCLPAFRAAFRLVGVAFRLEIFLVLNAEGECGAAIGALEGLVLKSHWMASSLKN